MCRPQMSTVIYWMSRRKIELSPRDKILEWGRIRTREHVQYASTYSESMVKNMAKKRESWSKKVYGVYHLVAQRMLFKMC